VLFHSIRQGTRGRRSPIAPNGQPPPSPVSAVERPLRAVRRPTANGAGPSRRAWSLSLDRHHPHVSGRISAVAPGSSVSCTHHGGRLGHGAGTLPRCGRLQPFQRIRQWRCRYRPAARRGRPPGCHIQRVVCPQPQKPRRNPRLPKFSTQASSIQLSSIVSRLRPSV